MQRTELPLLLRYLPAFCFSRLVYFFTRDRNVSFSGIATIRTSQYDYKWLYDPQFVGSFEDDNFVYFVFREIALEYMNCGKKIYSRIARICKNDSGGNTMMKNNWNTYLKARLNCSVSGEYPFYYDEVQSIEYLPDRKILAAVFTTPENSITGSAVCFFNMSEVHKAFEGSFKIQEGPTRTWESKAMTEQVKEHFRCGASLSPHQLMEYHQHHLMNDAVQPISAQPIYTTILETFTHVTVDVTPTKTGAQYVVFVATQDSNILKLAVLPEFKGVCLVEIWKLKDYKSQIRVQSLQFVKDTMSVYIGSETGVLRLIAHRCQRHRSRASCLGATDPYCGWDDGRDVCVDAPMHVHEARFVQSSDRCPTVDMPVDGGWSSWSEWEPCVQDNGPGYNGYNEKPDMCMCRHRKCDNPKPANGGENCEGTSTAVSNCTVHGGWSPWSPWSECSATCGIALKSRRRSCTAPEPKYGGRVCVGLDSHELYCSNLPPCPDPNLVPVDGGWSQWGPWTTCTSEGGPICGPNAGWRERRRTCNNPVPKYGGADCDGIKIEKQICDLRPCEIRRVTAWTPWVQIPSNSSDGGYTEKRFKFACKAPSPEQIKLTQVKDEERYCTSQGYCGPVPPPEADGWGEWGEWGACSAACGGGQQRRRRDCLRPPCRGQGTTLRACNTHSCKGEWSCWSDWSECGGECNVDGTSATGHRTRTRMCLSPEGCDDAGAALERRVCVNTCDDTDTGWSDWGEWGACIAEERVRKRSCVRGACIGPLVQVALCEDEIDNSLNAMPAYSQGIETASFVTLRDNNSMSVGAIVGCVVTAFVMVRYTKLCRAELPAYDVMRRFNASRPFLLLPRMLILRRCDAFVTNFTTAEFRFFVCFIGFIYCSRRKNSQLPWRRKTKVPSSPHYITAKQNSYVTVPLKDVPRKAKRQPSFTGISSSTSGIILSKSNNLSTNPNNHNNAVTTPKLYPKAIANEGYLKPSVLDGVIAPAAQSFASSLHRELETQIPQRRLEGVLRGAA
ncbi:Semaphorin-5A [Eumeta japonica]|uniref:Semaphorin-5A n=1 Tax=Eumeta variegata TaxID=151549 RepID=A0A4C1UJW6_EUMVA|nr:Semaphorin-5A [Eumeta japonica]